MKKYNISRSGYLSKFHEMLRMPRKVTLQLHQILRLPRKMNHMIDPHQIWNVIYNARSNKNHPPTAPNTAPATQSHSHDSSSSHMKRHLQCAEQHWFPSNITKYCACHEICKFKISAETPWIASANRKTIRRHSDDKIVISHPPPRRPSSPHLGDAFCMEKNNISRSGYLSKLHQVLRLPRRVTLQLHQILRLPRNMHPTLLNASIVSTPLFSTHLFSTPLFSTHLFSTPLFSMHLFSTHLFSEHLFSLGIYSLLASILSRHLFSLGIHSLLASILSGHLFSLGIYSLLASLLSWHLFSLGIYSLLASILSRHLFSLGIYSLSASILSWHLFPLGIYSLLASIPSGHLFSLGIYCLLALPLIIYYILYHIIFYHILIYFVVLSDVNHWFGSLFGQNRTVHNWSQMYSITSRHCVMPSLHPETTESRRSMTSMKLSRVKNNTCKEISLQKSGRLRLCNSENASFYPKLSLPSRTSYLTLLFFL